MKLIATLLLCAALCGATEAVRPACNASNRGRFWPEAANQSGAAAQQAARRGELQMCTIGLWKYRWEALVVAVPRTSKPATEPEHESPASTAVEE